MSKVNAEKLADVIGKTILTVIIANLLAFGIYALLKVTLFGGGEMNGFEVAWLVIALTPLAFVLLTAFVSVICFLFMAIWQL